MWYLVAGGRENLPLPPSSLSLSLTATHGSRSGVVAQLNLNGTGAALR